MLADLLDGLAELERPVGVRLRFILVENEGEAKLSHLVETFRARLRQGEEVVHAAEARLGIPFARNRVLDLALEAGADHLTFLDDDVRPDPRWLAELLGEAGRRRLDLAGGPIRLRAPAAGAGFAQRMVWRGVDFRMRRVERVAAWRQAAGTDAEVTIITSNWIARLDFFRRHGIRFDAALGFSGGSDTRLHRRVTAAGGRTGWVSSAIASETWPADRLTLGYLFRRGRDQSIAYFHQHHPQGGLGAAAGALGQALLRLALAVAALPLACLGSGVAATACARSLGTAVGRLAALGGAKSEHYRMVSGV
jgi:hypothetical protein